ncbi:S1 family peptidase [Ferrimonas aestuarii]|uniref:Trypsin-like peptidase domain-containing protein n=1 Tax=Ferrimonas aestuarii TaxID=2569539 RepID=A0A4U1BP21_9GAMM|nr:serine protease [Ferrimonas aestuarii]TKB56135.1 trypsin-like peptidase domain-containing protein [Ferrimonas aestuarii]
MKRLAVVALLALLVGCEATPVETASAIKTKKVLKKNIELPVDYPVAIYVDKTKPETGINFFGKLEEASLLVASDMFSHAEMLNAESDFNYLLRVKSNSRWDTVWGGYNSVVNLEVVDRQGNVVFSQETKKGSSGGYLDFDAVYNALAKVMKESLIDFVNQQGADKLTASIAAFKGDKQPIVDLKSLINQSKPNSSGTGFFIDKQGSVATAAHVVDECLAIEIAYEGKTYAATLKEKSNLLDLAVISSDIPNTDHANITESYKPNLGKPVFVTGFPLSGILSDYPSLTVGNVSSYGGLKGAKGQFQFTAPIQPGNSGGAVVDYQGHLVGIVSSSLNQSMMLEKAGTTAQNVNFGVEHQLFKKFLDKNKVGYVMSNDDVNFEVASQQALKYTNQVLCYQ